MKSQLHYYHTTYCSCSYSVTGWLYSWIFHSNRFTLFISQH